MAIHAYKQFKRAGRNYFQEKPKENKFTIYCVNLFYKMFQEREYLSGSIALERPFSERLIREYMKIYPSNYYEHDVIKTVMACDDSYILLKRNEHKQREKR